MPKIFVTDRQGNEYLVDGTNGFALMEVVRDQGTFDLAAVCGGMLSCSTCHVYVDPAWLGRLPEASLDERELVGESSHFASNSRLSCQIKITPEYEGLRVTVAPED